MQDRNESATDAVTVSRATPSDVDAIAELLLANEPPRGSLTGHFPREWVDAAVRAMPVIVAWLGGRLAGVLVSAPIETARVKPELAQMLEVYGGGEGAYIYGPICVADAARGRGVAGMLFDRLRAELPGREGILFIRKDNASSLRAHEKLAGMRVRGEFSTRGVAFVVLSYAG